MKTKEIKLLLEARKLFASKKCFYNHDVDDYVNLVPAANNGLFYEDPEKNDGTIAKKLSLRILLPGNNNVWYIDAFETIIELTNRWADILPAITIVDEDENKFLAIEFFTHNVKDQFTSSPKMVESYW